VKILFDYQVFALQSYGGASRYFVRLAQELAALGEDPYVVAPLHQNRYLSELAPGRVQGREASFLPSRAFRLIGGINRAATLRWIRRHAPDIVHETYFTAAQDDVGNAGRVVTVYDMIHEKFGHELRPWDTTTARKRAAVARADHVICISHSTKNDLCEIFDIPDEKVSVVHLGFEKFAPRHSHEGATPPERPYLLYVGRRAGYKNFDGFIRAVASRKRLKQEFDVIAFGGGGFSASEVDLISTSGFRQNAVRQVSGDDNLLGELYRSAAIFVYPSIYEGFGLPPLEAMAHDCPVVSSNASSMPEVIGDAGEYFEPTDTDAMAGALERVAFDQSLRNKLTERGRARLSEFSWARCGAETLDVYRAVLGRRN
jgi:glycosyltransferase involved in cell wall biosynthesis